MRYGFGVDIFGTNIKLGFFNENGDLLRKWKIPMPAGHSGNAILPLIAQEIEDFIRKNNIFEDDVIGIGVGIPGPVNGSGVVNKCVNLGWGVFNLDRALSGLTGFRVKSGNIANLSAIGEYWKGSGTANSVFVAMNVGLGGAVICNGKVVHGACGGGGEFGHILVNKQETESCTCGRKGCAEQYCSPFGIMRLTQRQLAAHKMPSALRRRSLTDYRDVVKAAGESDRVAKEVMQQFYDYLGQCLSAVCCVTNPDTIVLGGDFCEFGPDVIPNVAQYFRKYIFHANENVHIRLATLDRDACIYGAFKLVLDEVEGENK